MASRSTGASSTAKKAKSRAEGTESRAADNLSETAVSAEGAGQQAAQTAAEKTDVAQKLTHAVGSLPPGVKSLAGTTWVLLQNHRALVATAATSVAAAGTMGYVWGRRAGSRRARLITRLTGGRI